MIIQQIYLYCPCLSNLIQVSHSKKCYWLVTNVTVIYPPLWFSHNTHISYEMLQSDKIKYRRHFRFNNWYYLWSLHWKLAVFLLQIGIGVSWNKVLDIDHAVSRSCEISNFFLVECFRHGWQVSGGIVSLPG